ncbi:MAG: hypothetical protein ABWJ42_02515 [Sulfolobales archaeon]
MTSERMFDRSVVVGLIVGLLMGFVDTYGYVTTGYTTAELSIVITPILIKILLGNKSSLRSIVRGAIIAYGMSFATIIASGMLVTNAYTRYVYEKFFYGSDFPRWLYDPQCSYYVACSYAFVYIFTGLLSLPGIILAYLYRHLFLDKLQLPYPIAITSFIISGFIDRIRKFRSVYQAILIGLILQLTIFILNEPSIDLSPSTNTVIKGSIMSLSIDFIIIFLSLILPPRISMSIGLSSVLTALLILPLGYHLSLFSIGGVNTIDNILYNASWYEASVIFGSVLAIGLVYSYKMREALVTISKISLRGRDLILLIIMLFGFLSLFIASTIYTEHSVSLWYIVFSLIWVLILLPLLVILTTITVGEAGIASQSLYPFNTVYLYVTGFRGFSPYVFMDHYLGIPMPGSLSSATANIIKLSRMSGNPIVRSILLFVFSFSIGLFITLIYGILLLDTFFNPATSSERLIRWLPYVNWSILVYKGQLDLSVLGGGIIIGAIYMTLLLLVGLYTPLKISPLPYVIGLSLSPDYGLLFLVGAFVRLFISRFGIEAQERLILYSTALLVGSGLSIPLYVVLSSVLG